MNYLCLSCCREITTIYHLVYSRSCLKIYTDRVEYRWALIRELLVGLAQIPELSTFTVERITSPAPVNTRGPMLPHYPSPQLTPFIKNCTINVNTFFFHTNCKSPPFTLEDNNLQFIRDGVLNEKLFTLKITNDLDRETKWDAEELLLNFPANLL